MINWILERLGPIIFVVIFVSQVLRAALRARKAKAAHEAQRDDSDEERRSREVQEQIRRQIAARRGGQPPPAVPPPLSTESTPRPVSRHETTRLPELGGPLGRMLEELQRRAQPPPKPTPPVFAETHHRGEIERQQQLADKLQALKESRAVVQRRAAHVAADKLAEAESEPALRSAVRERAMADLNDPESLRRALVLREVLGPPVGLR